MLSFLPPALEDYLVDHSSAEEPLLAELRRETQATLAMPQMQVGPVEGALLRILAATVSARFAIEIGTYSGYSGLCLAAGMPEGGRLVTCDVDPVVTAVARRYFDRSPHGAKIEIRLGPALDTLTELARAGATPDLVFIDADKENYGRYWDAVVPMLRPGGLVVADNTLWSGRVLEPKEASDHGIVGFNRKVKTDPRVDHVLLSVRDGIMLARKR